jgi:hypothetical protein
MSASGLRIRGEPSVPGQLEFDSDDDVDVDQMFEDFAQNPFRDTLQRTRDTDEAALKAAHELKDTLAPGLLWVSCRG